LADCFTDEECERAVALLTVWFRAGPSCPSCGERNLDLLVWGEDDTHVTCAACGFVWDPNRSGPLST
jgi:Zn ribbon nucleic-acid-binding protein